MKLVIDREKWLRGEGNKDSRLRRGRDGKQCCVGFYAKALGATNDDITDCNILAYLDNPALQHPWGEENLDLSSLYEINDVDSEGITEAIRENIITSLFARHGVDVEFVN